MPRILMANRSRPPGRKSNSSKPASPTSSRPLVAPHASLASAEAKAANTRERAAGYDALDRERVVDDGTIGHRFPTA